MPMPSNAIGHNIDVFIFLVDERIDQPSQCWVQIVVMLCCSPSYEYWANIHLDGLAQACPGKKGMIVVKNNYYDAVWWSERSMNSCGAHDIV